MRLRPLLVSSAALLAFVIACVGDDPKGVSPGVDHDAALSSSGNVGSSSGNGSGSDGGDSDADPDGSTPEVEPEALGTVAWARLLATGSNGFPLAQVAVGADGSVVCAYTFSGTIDVLGTSLTAVNMNDIALLKLAPDGSLLWARSFGGTAAEHPYGLAVHDDGSIYMAGEFTSNALPFDPPLTRASTARATFVGRFAADGTPQKGITFDKAGVEGGNCTHLALRGDRLAVQCRMLSASQVTVGGQTTSPVLAGAGAYSLITLLDRTALDGIWATALDSQGAESSAGVAIAENGDVLFNVRVAGVNGNRLRDSKASVDVVVENGMAIGRLAQSSGLAPWVKAYEIDAGQLNPLGVAAGKDDTVVFLADFSGTMGFGSQTLAASGEHTDLVLGRLSAAGQALSARAFGGDSEDSAGALTTDRWGNVLATGRLSSMAVALDGKPFPEPLQIGGASEFLLKASDQLTAHWVGGATTANGSLYGLDVAVGHGSQVAQALLVQGSAALGDGEVTQSGAGGTHADVAVVMRAP